MAGYQFLKPKSIDLIVRDPKSKVPLSINGEFKAWVGSEGTYWKRQVNDGSAVICIPSTDIKKGGK